MTSGSGMAPRGCAFAHAGVVVASRLKITSLPQNQLTCLQPESSHRPNSIVGRRRFPDARFERSTLKSSFVPRTTLFSRTSGHVCGLRTHPLVVVSEKNDIDAPTQKNPPGTGDVNLDAGLRNELEAELRDSVFFIEYLLPRPVRKFFYFAVGANAALSLFISGTGALGLLSRGAVVPDSLPSDLLLDAGGMVGMGALYWIDSVLGQRRREKRERVRELRKKRRDREQAIERDIRARTPVPVVTTPPQSITGPAQFGRVDPEWMLRRMTRMGQVPIVGPRKGAVLQQLVAALPPECTIVEVGTLIGYSAITMAAALPPGGRIITIEKDWKFAFPAMRFVFQVRLHPVIDVKWGDALKVVPRLGEEWRQAGSERKIDLLFIDADVKEYLEYLRVAEPYLAPGAVVVADNVIIFKEQLSDYLDYVRTSDRYTSECVESSLAWRDDVVDGLEVTKLLS